MRRMTLWSVEIRGIEYDVDVLATTTIGYTTRYLVATRGAKEPIPVDVDWNDASAQDQRTLSVLTQAIARVVGYEASPIMRDRAGFGFLDRRPSPIPINSPYSTR